MKYQLKCCECGHITPTFSDWFKQNQSCPVCGNKRSEVEYFTDYSKLKDLLHSNITSFWGYFDFLPLEHRENIVSYTEGAVPIESCEKLNAFARRRGVHCQVYVLRSDLNGGTHSLKDPAGSLCASLLKENGYKEYCVASTGNTATSYAKYMAKAGVKFTNFAPRDIVPDSVEEIRKLGQTVEICNGDYAFAKKIAADYANVHHVLQSTGNIDPVRIEAKKTMVFEFLRQLGKMPDVYMQSVAGGTGPIALDKGVREFSAHSENLKMPRLILAQQDLCDPMVQAWEKATAEGFPEGYENDYPKLIDVKTNVSILSAGNPAMYPVLAPLVRKSDGDFVRVAEKTLPRYGRIAHRIFGSHIGPAAAVCLSGFYKAINEKKIRDGEVVVINLGESGRRNRAFIDAITNPVRQAKRKARRAERKNKKNE